MPLNRHITLASSARQCKKHGLLAILPDARHTDSGWFGISID